MKMIIYMHKTDFLSLDGHLLRLFVLVYDTGSVSKTASILGMNQSSASHGLERLRKLVGDPLFIRSGRGIIPTSHADATIDKARSLLRQMEEFSQKEDYDPKQDSGLFRIAANDYEAETALKPFLTMLQKQAPGISLQIIRSQTRKEWIPLLREDTVDLVLAPLFQGSETDLSQQKLFSEEYCCYFDPEIRNAPSDLDEFCEAPHAIMVTGAKHRTEIDERLALQKRERQIRIVAPSFAILATMMRGTNIIATLPSRLKEALFADFETCPPPLPMPDFAIAQIWHSRYNKSARHQWLRRSLQQTLSGSKSLN